MIVEMKKVTLLCQDSQQDHTLKTLRNTGVLHLSHINNPATENYARIHAEIDRINQALAIVSLHESEDAEEPPERPAPEALDAIFELSDQKEKLNDRIRTLEEQIKPLRLFGEFDPKTIKSLKDKGIDVKLYYVPGKHLPEFPDNVTVFTAHATKRGTYLAVLSKGDIQLDFSEIPLPSRSISRIEKEIEQAGKEILEIEKKLAGAIKYNDSLKDLRRQLEINAEYVQARDGMGKSESISYLQGFCPADRIEDLKEKAATDGWGLVVEDPDDKDHVPTLLRHPKWVKPLKPVLAFLGIAPGYTESDISPAFFGFLTIFFAMIVGDAGYGILILIGTLIIARIKKLALSGSVVLLLILSGTTTVWGLLTGNFFGIDPDLIPYPLNALKIDWLLKQENSMAFCLVLGAIHLTLAHLWNMVDQAKKNVPKIIGQIGWIGILWTMYMLASFLLLETELPSFFLPVAVTGAVAVVLSLVLQKTWVDLAMLILDIINNFGDIMSYLRLFALGIASVKVAQAFNAMALDLGGAITSSVSLPSGYIAAAVPVVLILLFGHLLNLVLCILSVLVHGVRLNTLEFSTHVGLKWSGITYKPFALKENKLPVAAAS